MNGMKSENRWCVGRFRFTLREAVTLSGRSQSIYRLDVKTMPIPPDGAKAVWQKQIARIRTLKTPPGTTQVIVREFDLLPGVQAVWYLGDQFSADERFLEIMKPMGDHVLLMTSDGAETGKEEVAESLVSDVAKAYVPDAEHGFCVGYGAITSLPSRSEEARAAFEYKKVPKFEITFTTTTVGEPSIYEPMADIEQQSREMATKGGQIRVLRNEPRVVAGLKGKEGRISVTSPGEQPFVRFTWHFSGVGGSSEKPEIIFLGMAPTEHQGELETI